MILFAIETLCVLILCLTLVAIIIDERKNRSQTTRLIKLKGYWDGSERRGTERLNISLPVKYTANAKTAATKSVDLSSKGIRLLLDERLETGTLLRLEIQLPNDSRPIKAAGEVMWAQEAFEEKEGSAKRLFTTGIGFCKFHDSDEERLFEFIHSL